MLRELTFTAKDLDGVRDLDARMAAADEVEPWVQHFYIHSIQSVLDNLGGIAPALAMPYNCGTIIAAPDGRLAAIDLVLIENYFAGLDWNIPGRIYDLIADRIDLLVVSHGHWDHCWIELMRLLISRGKTVIVPEGINSSQAKPIPGGCRGVSDGESLEWGGLHFFFRFGIHAYDNGRNIRMLITEILDGRNRILHTADADMTNAAAFPGLEPQPVDILLFKCGGVSALVEDYEELEQSIELVRPRRLILPMHLNELGHRGTDASRPYSLAYDWLARYRKNGLLGTRRYGVLFGNRAIRL